MLDNVGKTEGGRSTDYQSVRWYKLDFKGTVLSALPIEETQEKINQTSEFSDSIGETNNLKVGLFIRTKLRQLSKSGFILSDRQLRDICDWQWGKQTFRLVASYPFAKIVDGTESVSSLAKDERGNNRYWNEIFSFGDVDLIICSQWYERNRDYFNEWFSALGSDVASEHVTINEENATRIRRTTVKASLINFSNNYKGQIKTRSEIVEELSAKFGYNEHSILPADYEIGLNNSLPKLFRRINHGTYECLGYNSTHVFSDAVASIYTSISDDEKEKILNVIVTRFMNGLRMSSIIDFERFKNYFFADYEEDFEYDSDWFNNLLSTEALVYDDRAYIYKDEVVDSVRLYIKQMDSPCIFINAFFEKFSCELYSFSIFSSEMLRAFIEKNYPDISVKWDYILLQENVSPSDLIKGVFSERETWSLDELQQRLPFLKMDTIRQMMNSAEFFRVDKGTYTHIDNIDLPNSEGDSIRAFVESKLRVRDYVTANELELSRLMDLNPHCSFAAIRDAVFYKFLSNSYDKSGQVITRSGGKLRVLDIMEQYCREADSVSFEELNAFEATFDPEGRTHSQCLIAGHNTMVRVSAELFVSDNQVNFDVSRVDEAISLYCHDEFIPLREVTDFSLFPFAGFSWNLFLLESYVRRFSRVFKYDVRAVNSANIGAIVRKTFDYYEYDDVLAYALAKSSLPLSDKSAVSNYLFDNGYIGWRNLGKSESRIIKSAKALREGRTV